MREATRWLVIEKGGRARDRWRGRKLERWSQEGRYHRSPPHNAPRLKAAIVDISTDDGRLSLIREIRPNHCLDE